MIAPLAESEQDPQDFGGEFDEGDEEEGEGGEQDGAALDRVICDKLKQQTEQPRAPSASGGALEKQPSNESEFSAKTPPPELMGTLSEANKKEMVEPIPVYACTSSGDAQPTTGNLTVKKRRKKRDSAGHKVDSAGDGKEAAMDSEGPAEAESKGDPVCPWEDE